MDGILSEVKVLELAHAPSGAFCAKLLADQGADTIKVEPPGSGDQARHEPPFIGGEPHPDRSTTFLALNTNKRGITLDLEQAEGRALFLRLASDADVDHRKLPARASRPAGAGIRRAAGREPEGDPALHHVLRAARPVRQLQGRRPDRPGDGRLPLRGHRAGGQTADGHGAPADGAHRRPQRRHRHHGRAAAPRRRPERAVTSTCP